MKKKDYIIIAIILLAGLGLFFGLKSYLDKNYETETDLKLYNTIEEGLKDNGINDAISFDEVDKNNLLNKNAEININGKKAYLNEDGELSYSNTNLASTDILNSTIIFSKNNYYFSYNSMFGNRFIYDSKLNLIKLVFSDEPIYFSKDSIYYSYYDCTSKESHIDENGNHFMVVYELNTKNGNPKEIFKIIKSAGRIC